MTSSGSNISSFRDIPSMPTGFSASIAKKNVQLKLGNHSISLPNLKENNVQLKFGKASIQARMYKGADKGKIFETRSWRTLYVVKHVKINVKINNVSYPILVRKSVLQEKLNVPDEKFHSLLEKAKDGDGTLDLVVRLKEIEKIKNVVKESELIERDEARLQEGQTSREVDHTYITHKTKTTPRKDGKLKVYKNLNREIGKGSFKRVMLYAKVSSERIKMMAYAEVKPSNDMHEYQKRIQEAQGEYRMGRNLYDNFKASHPDEGIPFLKYRLAIDRKPSDSNSAQPSFGMLMEHCDSDLKKADIDPAQKGDVFLGVLKGVAFMNANGIVHRDLKPANVMLKRDYDEDGNVVRCQAKIIDFGLSGLTEDLTNLNHFKGSWAYAAPEAYIPRRFEGDATKLDSWSLGVMLYEMQYGEMPPFDSAIADFQNNKASSEKVVEAMASFHIEHDHDHPIETAIHHLLDMDPSTRWSAQQALEYLSGVRDEIGELQIG